MMDSQAEFRRLYEAHRAAVHAYFTGRTGERQQAADLMQEVSPRTHVLAATAPGLDPAWWRQHSAGFATRMVACTAPVRYAA